MRRFKEPLIYLLVVAILSHSVAARPIGKTTYETDRDAAEPPIQTAQLPNPTSLMAPVLSVRPKGSSLNSLSDSIQRIRIGPMRPPVYRPPVYRRPSGSMPPRTVFFPFGPPILLIIVLMALSRCAILICTLPRRRERENLFASVHNHYNGNHHPRRTRNNRRDNSGRSQINPPKAGPPPSYTRPPSYHESQDGARTNLPTATTLPPMYAEMVRGQP